jgi:hypothetical protein
MPPPVHLKPKPPRRLKRTTWGNIRERFARYVDSFERPLNDLSHEDRIHRQRAVMWHAYTMGRRDQRDVTNARFRGAAVFVIRAKR